MRKILILAIFIINITVYSTETFKVSSTQPETSYGLWVEKGERIVFSVEGEWTMWDKWENTDYRGHRNFKKVGSFYLGTLIGRIEGGKDFAITDGLKYISPVSGLLIMFPNRGAYAQLIASGELAVTVDGGKSVSKDEAEKLSGWDITTLDTARSETYLTDKEKDVILLLNKVRSNPSLFAKQYLENRKNSGAYAMECYKELLAAIPLPVLQPSKALHLAAKDHATDMGKKGLVGHNGSDKSSPYDRVVRYGKFTGKYTGPWENCSYGFENPLEIVLQLLIDDGVVSRGHRKNIMETNTRFVGVSIMPHKTYTYNCVQDFADSIIDS